MFSLRRLAAGTVAVSIVVTVIGGWAAPAGAHPFLVRTDPAQGARLRAAPRTISLQFSEPLGDGRDEVSIVRSDRSTGEPLPTTRTGDGRVLRGDVSLGTGVYTVQWRVVADDGHLSEGRFSFAVGAASGSLPRAESTAAPASPFRSAVAWVFFAGLALTLGSVATGLLIDRSRRTRRGALAAGLAVALVASAAAWAAATAGIGGPVGSDRQVTSLAVSTALLAIGLLFRRQPPVAGLLVLGAASAWSARGQVGVTRGWVGVALDSIHLVAAAAWAGALALLVGELWQARREPTDLRERVRRYSTLAVVPVVVLAAAGAVSATLMVPAVGDLWSTGYGRLLGAKTVLFATAVAVAWRARRRARTNPGSPSLVRRLTTAEASILAGVLVVAAVLANTAPPPPRAAASSLLGPPPMAGPVVRDAGLAGILTVAVTAGDGRLQVEVLAPGGGERRTRAEVTVVSGGARSRALALDDCGPGCLTGTWHPPAGRSAVRVEASAPGWRCGSYTATITWPPGAEDPALLARVLAVMRAQPAVEMTERTSSGPDSVVVPTTFRQPGAALVDEEPYASGQADDVRPLPGGDGLTLYLPGDRIWATMWLDRAGRIARERIVNVGHLIEREYRYPAR